MPDMKIHELPQQTGASNTGYLNLHGTTAYVCDGIDEDYEDGEYETSLNEMIQEMEVTVAEIEVPDILMSQLSMKPDLMHDIDLLAKKLNDVKWVLTTGMSREKWIHEKTVMMDEDDQVDYYRYPESSAIEENASIKIHRTF